MEQEGPFHTNPVRRDAPHGEGGICSAAADTNDRALEGLHALALTLDDADVYLHAVARA